MLSARQSIRRGLSSLSKQKKHPRVLLLSSSSSSTYYYSSCAVSVGSSFSSSISFSNDDDNNNNKNDGIRRDKTIHSPYLMARRYIHDDIHDDDTHAWQKAKDPDIAKASRMSGFDWRDIEDISEYDEYLKKENEKKGEAPIKEGEEYLYLSDEQYNLRHEKFVEEMKLRNERLKEDLEKRKGRLFEDPWELSDEFLASSTTYFDLPDWTSKNVSRAALQKIKMFHQQKKSTKEEELEEEEKEKKKEIPMHLPTISQLSMIPAPFPMGPPLPSQNIKKNGMHRLSSTRAILRQEIPRLCNPKLLDIFLDPTLGGSQEEQQAEIDKLYEYVQDTLKTVITMNNVPVPQDIHDKNNKIVVAMKQPDADQWIEDAVMEYLTAVREQLEAHNESLASSAQSTSQSSSSSSSSSSESDSDSESSSTSNKVTTTTLAPEPEDTYSILHKTLTDLKREWEAYDGIPKSKVVLPTFMDLYPVSPPSKKTAEAAAEKEGDESSNNNNKKKKNKNNKNATQATTTTVLSKKDVLDNLFPVTGIKGGNIQEEWELSAHDESLRIMARKPIIDVAKLLCKIDKAQLKEEEEEEINSTIFVTGDQHCGKSTLMTAIAGSARYSDYIVLYLPDGARFAEMGKYIEPSTHPAQKGKFIIPYLSKELCEQLLAAHKEQIQEAELVASKSDIKHFFTESEIKSKNLFKDADEEVSLVKLLEMAKEDIHIAAPVYNVVIHILMNQTKFPFLVVLDEYNQYHLKNGHFFHMAYDDAVRNSVPCQIINLFEPFMKCMPIVKHSYAKGKPPTCIEVKAKEEGISMEEAMEKHHAFLYPNEMEKGPKRGAILTAISHSRPVPKSITDALVTEIKKSASSSSSAPPHVVNVPRYSRLETETMLAHYECVGVGDFRFDEGAKITNPQEVAFLRMVSGGIGVKLLNASLGSAY